jgi:DNA-binding transcriptional ArsR family regulator
MISDKAHTLLSLRRAHQDVFLLKGELSLEILLFIASKGGLCPLKEVYKCDFATPVALRQHIGVLTQDGLIELLSDSQSKRSKRICLTERAIKKLRVYEAILDGHVNQWQKSQSLADDGRLVSR